tara:strand:+ start:846 stop:1091 length:246 start_codon:yes stop_codon:yes gene_type:complete
MSGKMLDKDLYIKNLEGYVTQFSEYQKVLEKLVTQVEKEVPQYCELCKGECKDQGKKHLWETVNESKELLYGPTSGYIDQG